MAAPVLLYLLKANLALLLFAAAYFGLLRRLTFFTLNRAYLVFALLFAAVYPALPVPALLPVEVVQPVAFALGEATAGGAVARPVTLAMNWPALALALYAAGAAVLLARLLEQLLSLWRVRRQSRPAVVQGQAVRVLAGMVSPFSFGTNIYLNPDLHPAPELAAVLRHEQVHVRQWHTLDGLLAQLMLAAAWCNPAAWLLRRAVLDNLEYLADHAVLQAGLDRQAYQFSLLRLSHGAAGPSLVSHFSFPTLKNRVVMMNIPLSSTGQLARYFVAGPLVLAVALGLAAALGGGATLTPATAAPLTARTKAAGPAVYYLDGKLSDKATVDGLDPKSIAFVNVLEEATARRVFGATTGGVVIVVTKDNQNSAAVRALNNKLARVAPLVPATPAQKAATAAVEAYIKKTYPNATVRSISGPRPLSGATTPRYKAEIEDGGQTKQLYFDANGQPGSN